MEPDAKQPSRARAREHDEQPHASRPSLLLLNLYMAYPPNSGAKVVIYNRLVELSKHFRITFCCLGEHTADAHAALHLGRFAEVIVARGVRRQSSLLGRLWSLLRDPCAVEFVDKLAAWFESDEMQQLLSGRRFDVIELHSSCWYRRRLRVLAGLKVLVAHNRELEYYTQRARVAWGVDGRVAGIRASLDAFLVAMQERRAIAGADAVVSLAPLETAQRRRWFADLPVLCNWGGVDLKYYRSVDCTRSSSAPMRGPVLVFIAAFFVEGARDAALRFAREALPAIVQSHPRVRLVLVGDHRGNGTIARLATEHPEIDVVGLVPDVRPYLHSADVVVVPIVRGSGVRYKIMEALAAGKPVVATQKAAEGLGLVSGQDILLAETVPEMAPLVTQVLRDNTLRSHLSHHALDAARDKFDRVAEHQRLADWYLNQVAARA
jgi:glycosyltransferase involved in cell wall biosynthesis